MMRKRKNSYRLTLKACYLGFMVQATVVNLTPVLFIPLRNQFGLSFGSLGLLVFINFITQVTVDIAFSHAVDRRGYRPFLVMAHVFSALGFAVFAASPVIFKTPYIGFILGTIIFSAGGGLLELLISPTVNAIPLKAKSSAMSLLHSFYAWGQMGVVILTTLFILLFGRQSWPVIMLLWAIPPVINAVLFSRAPIAAIVPEEKREGFKKHIMNRFFIAAFFAIAFGGASEIVMNQWASAFMEEVMKIPKAIGDISGMSMFAFMLGMGRLLHGKYGERFNLNKIMLAGTVTAFICYLTVAFSPIDAVSLAACAICGIAVSLLWPGTLVLSADRFPLAGTWLFAFLAAGGDIGASVGPWIVGIVSDNASGISFLYDIGNRLGLDPVQLGMRSGILVGALFPLLAFVCLLYMKRNAEKNRLPRTDLT